MSGYLVSSTILGSTFVHAISLISITMITSKSLDQNHIRVQWHEDNDCSFNWFWQSLSKALTSLPNAPSHHPFQSLAFFTFLSANSVTAYGSPIQTDELEGASMTGRLHQSFRRDETRDTKLGAFIPMILVVVIIFVAAGWVKVYMARRRNSREAGKGSDEAEEALPEYSSAGNCTQYSNASGTGQTWAIQPTYPISALSHSRGEHVILREIAALPADIPAHSAGVHAGSHAENPQRLQLPFYSLGTDTPHSSSSVTLTHSRRPTGSRGGPRAETVYNHSLANSNPPSEVPPSYSEMIAQSSRSR